MNGMTICKVPLEMVCLQEALIKSFVRYIRLNYIKAVDSCQADGECKYNDVYKRKPQFPLPQII